MGERFPDLIIVQLSSTTELVANFVCISGSGTDYLVVFRNVRF